MPQLSSQEMTLIKWGGLAVAALVVGGSAYASADTLVPLGVAGVGAYALFK